MSKKVLTRQEYLRLYMRCRTRGMNIANLRGNDLRVFVSECMESEKEASRQTKLTKDRRLKRALKLVTKQKRREQKPQKPKKHRFIYQNITPSDGGNPLQDFFIDPNKIQDPKKAELDEFMDKNPYGVDYDVLMRKLKEIEQNE